MIFNLFIANSKVYFYAGTEVDDLSRDGYYTIDFNGGNLKDIDIPAYNEAAQSIDYVISEAGYDDQYLIYNNKYEFSDEDLLETIGIKCYTYNLETNSLNETFEDNIYSFIP